MEMTETAILLDMYKVVRRKSMETYKVPPSGDLKKRIIFVGAGYVLAAVMESAFAEYAAKNDENVSRSMLLLDVYFSESPITDDETAKKYGMKMSEYKTQKECAIKEYGKIIDKHMDSLVKSLYVEGA